jgi:hypothetical protein
MLWTGYALTGLFVLFMLFDVAIKWLRLPIVDQMMLELGYRAGIGFWAVAARPGTAGGVSARFPQIDRRAVTAGIVIRCRGFRIGRFGSVESFPRSNPRIWLGASRNE